MSKLPQVAEQGWGAGGGEAWGYHRHYQGILDTKDPTPRQRERERERERERGGGEDSLKTSFP